MTNKPKLTPSQIERFINLPLHEIEERMEGLRDSNSNSDRTLYRAARQALSQRQRTIKSAVMEFEATNTHHLLCYDSTANFVKIAGTSVVFFTTLIAPRLHWRYSVKTDTDHYSVSEDGIISLRSFEGLTSQLANIGIFPDPKLSTSDLHFFQLSKVYSESQIATLRDRIASESERITAMLIPNSPLPLLYEAINEAVHLIYYRFKHVSDTYAREIIAPPIIKGSQQLVLEYLAYANAPKSEANAHLQQIRKLAVYLRHNMAYLSTLNILHHRDIYHILEHLTTIERLSTQASKRLTKVSRVSA